MSLQLVRPVELFIAASVASGTTTNTGEMWESAEEQCIHRSQILKRSMTLLLSSTQMFLLVQPQQELHYFSLSGKGQGINRLPQGHVASPVLHVVCVSL